MIGSGKTREGKRVKGKGKEKEEEIIRSGKTRKGKRVRGEKEKKKKEKQSVSRTCSKHRQQKSQVVKSNLNKPRFCKRDSLCFFVIPFPALPKRFWFD